MKGKMTFQLITEGEVEFDILDEYIDNFEDLKDIIWHQYIDIGEYKLLSETLDDKGQSLPLKTAKSITFKARKRLFYYRI